MVRVLVVDDQPHALDRLSALLATESDIEVAGTCTCGAEAVNLIRSLKPDLVFLDVQLPGLDAFGVVDAVGPATMPATIFVTVFDEFAVRAFEAHGLDYLLKPFGRARFVKALDAARLHIGPEHARDRVRRLEALLRDIRGGTTPDRLMVRSDGRVRFIDVDQIHWAEAEGNYVRVHTPDGSMLIRHTLSDMLARLGRERFLRIHRSRIVRVDRIVELRFASGGEYDVVMKDGLRLGMSRYCRDAVQARLISRAPAR